MENYYEFMEGNQWYCMCLENGKINLLNGYGVAMAEYVSGNFVEVIHLFRKIKFHVKRMMEVFWKYYTCTTISYVQKICIPIKEIFSPELPPDGTGGAAVLENDLCQSEEIGKEEANVKYLLGELKSDFGSFKNCTIEKAGCEIIIKDDTNNVLLKTALNEDGTVVLRNSKYNKALGANLLEAKLILAYAFNDDGQMMLVLSDDLLREDRVSTNEDIAYAEY